MISNPAIFEPLNWTESTLIGKPKIEARKNGKPMANRFEGLPGESYGGNLNTIEGIWGSKYMPAIKDGDILL